MAFNPSKEVAVARSAARSLDAPMAVVLWISRDGKKVGMASYGETLALCSAAKEIGNTAFDAVMRGQ